MPLSGHGAPTRAPRRRPHEIPVRERAQKLGGLAVKTLGAIMKGQGQDAVRLAAAREVLDRAYGRPKLGDPEAGAGEGMTVIVKRFSDVTPEEEAEAEARS